MAVDAQNLKSHHAGMDSMLNFGMDFSRELSEGQAALMQRGGAGSSGGGGRRKQSKPIRVFMDMAPAEGEVRPAEAMDAGDIPELTQPRSPRHTTAMDIDDLINCDLCNDTFLTQSSLTEHIQAVHDLGSDNNGPSIFPTKYHQAGIQLQQEVGLPSSNGGSPDLPATSKSVSEDRPMHIMGRSHSPDDNSNSQGTSSPGAITGENRNRIFHQDAFCNLCDREFCNKYFLKTHMANKHGVYESGSPSESPKLPLPAMNGNGNGPSFAETLASLPQMHANGSGQSAFGPPPVNQATSQPLEMQPVNKPPSQPSMPCMPLPPSLPTSQPVSMSLQPPENVTAKTSPPRSLPQTPSKSGSGATSKDMEDYCEICQKHFCNKYYLKKHKQDVHGIIPEPSPQSGKRGRPTMSVNSSKSSSPLTDSITSNSQLPLLPPGLDALAGNAGMPPGLGNVMFINPFAPPFALLQTQPSVLPGFPHGLPPPPPVSAGGNESPTTAPRPPSSSTSPGSLPPPSTGDRHTPVNPEAYCDLCRKEFCNKHFLKIHKANKHGVFYEDLPAIIQQASMSQLPVLNVPSIPTPGSSSNADNSNAAGVIHIAPTAMEAGVKIKSEKPDGAKYDNPLKARDLSMTPLPMRGEMCNVCKKEFNNRYSLQIHMINAHNMKPADLDMALGMSEPKSEHMLQGTMFSNMIAAKLADRVMCDICNKEVCNKYFLKTHKLKVHGIDTTKEEREKESPPKTTPSTTSVIQAPKMTPLPSQPMKEMPSIPKPSTPSIAEPTTPTPRPNDEELLKMGIDPEAYCEICKKEFCSKYFLKTHRANIHGIKTNGTNGTPEKLERPPMKPMGPTGPPPLLPFPLPDGKEFPGLPGLPQSLAQSISQSLGHLGQQHPLSLPSLTQPPQMPPNQAPPPPLLGFGGDSWSWKDPMNAQRVRCEICNKDLCNRYFLKTHMLNKHGINYDPITGTNLPTSQSNSQMQPENLSLRPEDKKDEVKPGDHDDSSDSRSTISAKTWHVPPTGTEKMEVSSSASINNKENMPREEKKEFVKSSEGSYFIQKCELCGMIFGEKVNLQLHMIHDHQGQVTVSTEPPCPSGTQLAFNLKKKYQRRKLKGMRFRRFGPSVGGAIGEKVRSAIVNHIANHQKNKKKFRCAHCQERFLSKPQCQAHIRQMHPNVKPSTTSSADDSSRSPAPSKLAAPLANNNQGEMAGAAGSSHNVIMQTFNLEEKNQQLFAASTVHLPVYHKISEPVSVTFTLTPTANDN